MALKPSTAEQAVDARDARAEEADLVRRFRQERDPSAFAELYRMHRRAIFGTCLRYLGDPAAAEDGCHDVFVQAWERFDTLRGEAFGAWVRRIAINHCLNRQRHRSVERRSEPELARELEERAPPSTLGVVQARDELGRAARIVRELSSRQRRVFLLRHVEQLAYAEIEHLTGLSAGEVRSALQNARRNFRLGWNREGMASPPETDHA